MNRYFFLFPFTIFMFAACQKIDSGKISSNIKNQWHIKTTDGKISIINLKKFKDDSIELNIPKDWKIQKLQDVWKYFPCDAKNPKLYFAIQKYDSNDIRMDSEQYLIESFKQVSDKIDQFHYILKKLNFKNGEVCYINTIFTKEKSVDYATYDLICQSGNSIYDFTFKTIQNDKSNEVNYRKFLLIVQSFEFNHKKPIGNEIIISEKEIKFEDI